MSVTFACRPSPVTPRQSDAAGEAQGVDRSRGCCQGLRAATLAAQNGAMTLAIILLVVAIVLILLGVFVEAAKFLLWIGLVILIIAIIAWLMRVIRRNA